MRELAVDVSDELEHYKHEIDAHLDAYLSEAQTPDVPEHLRSAFRYATLAPGKRLRPMLVIAANACCGGRTEDIYPLACAVEMIHVASLIHDDLPVMDNHAIRRNQPALHRSHTEGMAVVAGVALVAYAFEVASGLRHPNVPGIISRIARTVGGTGMSGGQVLDLQAREMSRGAPLDERWLETFYLRKTGSLMALACEIGALAAGRCGEQVSAFHEYGMHLGLAFQINDDVLDRVSDRSTGRPNYSNFCDVETARARVSELMRTAEDLLAPFGRRAMMLRGLATTALAR